MSYNIEYACIVDAYSTGSELAGELHKIGYKLLHIQTMEDIPGGYIKSFKPEIFEEKYFINHLNAEKIVAQIQNYKPVVIIAGSEPGVEWADYIAHKLGLPGNSPSTSRQRRNKFLMAETLQKAGLKSIKQANVNSFSQLLNLTKQWDKWPVVLKPLASAGSDGVYFCNNEQDLEFAFNSIYMKPDFLGNLNKSVLIQEFIVGQQYVVNSMSINGLHKITEMWAEYRLSDKTNGNIYDKELLIPYEGDTQSDLVKYTKQVLDALNFTNGAGHAEIMMTSDGPVLIEIGARLQGGIVSHALVKSIGDSHITMALKRYLEPQTFIKEINQPYQLKKHSMVVNLISKKDGILKENHCQELLSTLPSFYLIARTPNIGDYIPKTVNLFTKPGHIYLIHEEIDQLYKDYEQIRHWEKEDKLLVLN